MCEKHVIVWFGLASPTQPYGLAGPPMVWLGWHSPMVWFGSASPAQWFGLASPAQVFCTEVPCLQVSHPKGEDTQVSEYILAASSSSSTVDACHINFPTVSSTKK
jgi:hypothetical protein